MARPAAPSLALLMRRPVDRRCMDLFNALWVLLRFLCAFNDVMLVLIVSAMFYSSVNVVFLPASLPAVLTVSIQIPAMLFFGGHLLSFIFWADSPVGRYQNKLELFFLKNEPAMKK
jgi:hypothetical protein